MQDFRGVTIVTWEKVDEYLHCVELSKIVGNFPKGLDSVIRLLVSTVCKKNPFYQWFRYVEQVDQTWEGEYSCSSSYKDEFPWAELTFYWISPSPLSSIGLIFWRLWWILRESCPFEHTFIKRRIKLLFYHWNLAADRLYVFKRKKI